MTSRYTLEDDDDSRSASPIPHRRNSISEGNTRPNVFLVEVHRTKARLLRQEDTDGDERVTIHDTGPKHMTLPIAQSSYARRSIKGNYMISSLLQELALLEDLPTEGPKPLVLRSHAVISESQLKENPVDRLNRMISQYFWPALVRRVDADGLTVICMDPKNRSANKRPRVYVPNGDDFAFDYFDQVAKTRIYLDLEVIRLPAIITPEYVCSINDRPGILALDLERNKYSEVVGKPFIVPGGRFNEMYGWDSYFAALGLLADPNANAVHIAKSMVDNFVYQINHYGKILNANRSYYLLRSQLPFLTDMGLRVHQKLKSADHESEKLKSTGNEWGSASADEWLKRVMVAAIKEYEQVWKVAPRFVEEIGLSRYYSQGQGIPPETEASHFDSHLRPFAEKHGCDISTFIKLYNEQIIDEPELDEYFCHDRSVRESGHDTTYRLDNCAANLLTIDLCSLLYKYEKDIANYIEKYCGGSLRIADKEHLSCDWTVKAERRRELANKYLWNEEKGMYFDYDIVHQHQTTYESATTFWALWSRMASPHQADLLVTKALCRFEVPGGIVSGTKESLGTVSLDRPNRQWDYPTGWAPHQMLAWEGLVNYGYSDDARRLVYRWLYMITCAFVDFNGVVPEKFNVVQMSHKVDAEYGNVGTEFKKVPREGFGWMNASYLVGQQYLTKLERRALGALVPLDSLLKNKNS